MASEISDILTAVNKLLFSERTDLKKDTLHYLSILLIYKNSFSLKK